MVSTASIFTELKITQISVLDISCSESLPNLMKLENRAIFHVCPYIKHGFPCTHFDEAQINKQDYVDILHSESHQNQSRNVESPGGSSFMLLCRVYHQADFQDTHICLTT